MKWTQENRHETTSAHLVRACLKSCRAIGDAIARAKETVLRDYTELAGEHVRLLRLALNEAEALAWQTDYPHLFFPTLATEKAEAAVSWHRHQRAVRRTTVRVSTSVSAAVTDSSHRPIAYESVRPYT